MGDTDIKIEKTISGDTISDILRKLAEEFENGEAFEERFVPVEALDFEKLKLEFKRKNGQTRFKMKLKPLTVIADGDTLASESSVVSEAKPRYKSLKKRMKKDYKLIFNTIQDGSIPPKDVVESFISDSLLMITYPGYGDEFYDQYAESVREFQRSYDQGLVSEMRAAIEKVDKVKSISHNKYK
ncbi:MAG: GAK system XXXCH domain-containing protein [candidate division Zixibacteria bacterium]|nr:GAK system XXXCH domain-containing protein [candidate division Zixibacteria bacterium]